MARQGKQKSDPKIVREGYQPKIDAGYKPATDPSDKDQTPKPPKGGSGIQPAEGGKGKEQPAK